MRIIIHLSVIRILITSSQFAKEILAHQGKHVVLKLSRKFHIDLRCLSAFSQVKRPLWFILSRYNL